MRFRSSRSLPSALYLTGEYYDLANDEPVLLAISLSAATFPWLNNPRGQAMTKNLYFPPAECIIADRDTCCV